MAHKFTGGKAASVRSQSPFYPATSRSRRKGKSELLKLNELIRNGPIAHQRRVVDDEYLDPLHPPLIGRRRHPLTEIAA